MKKVKLIGFETPDYFTGTVTTTTVQIPVYKSITNKELAEAIQNDLTYLEEIGASRQDLARYDDFVEELMQEPTNVYVEVSNTPFNELPPCLYFDVVECFQKNNCYFH